MWLCFGLEVGAFVARGGSHTNISWSSMITFQDRLLEASLQLVSGVLLTVKPLSEAGR
jgi:hypothetical protein